MSVRRRAVLSGFVAAAFWAGLSGDTRRPTRPPETALGYEESNGKALFATYCSICHGAGGEGDGFNAFNLKPRPRNLADAKGMDAFTDEQLYDAIFRGGAKRGKSNLMPPWEHRLNQRQIHYLVVWLRRLRGQ